MPEPMHQVVVVDWDDAFTSSHRHTIREFEECEDCQNFHVSTAGFLVSEKNGRIILGSERIGGTDDYKHFSSIPRADVLRIHYYKLDRTVEVRKELAMPHKSKKSSYPASKGHPGKKGKKKRAG